MQFFARDTVRRDLEEISRSRHRHCLWHQVAVSPLRYPQVLLTCRRRGTSDTAAAVVSSPAGHLDVSGRQTAGVMQLYRRWLHARLIKHVWRASSGCVRRNDSGRLGVANRVKGMLRGDNVQPWPLWSHKDHMSLVTSHKDHAHLLLYRTSHKDHLPLL